MEYSRAPSFLTSMALLRIASDERRGYSGAEVENRTDWEQKEQSSGHCPDFALMMEQSLTPLPLCSSLSLLALENSSITSAPSSAKRRRASSGDIPELKGIPLILQHIRQLVNLFL